MIIYEHGRWGVWFVFQSTGSVFPRALAWAVPSSLLAAALGYADHLTTPSNVITALAGFISLVGFLIVFRSNQAYSRYCDGFTLVRTARGQWFNAASSLFAFCSRSPEKAEEVRAFQKLVSSLMSLLFATALSTLSGDIGYDVFNLEAIDRDTIEFFDQFSGGEAKVELILQWIQRSIVDNLNSGVLGIPPPILSRVFQELSTGMGDVASARKINDLPLPFHYAQIASVMLLIYSFGAPAFSAYIFVTPYAAAGSAFLNVAALWSVNYIAVEIEAPFGTSPNSLPLSGEIDRMNELLAMLLTEGAKRAPQSTGMASDTRTIVKMHEAFQSFQVSPNPSRSVRKSMLESRDPTPLHGPMLVAVSGAPAEHRECLSDDAGEARSGAGAPHLAPTASAHAQDGGSPLETSMKPSVTNVRFDDPPMSGRHAARAPCPTTAKGAMPESTAEGGPGTREAPEADEGGGRAGGDIRLREPPADLGSIGQHEGQIAFDSEFSFRSDAAEI